jgi:TonB family protein
MKSVVRILVVAVLIGLIPAVASAVRLPREYVYLKKAPQPAKGWEHFCKCFSYPESARLDRVTGTVVISVLVLSDGTVGKVRLEEGVRADLNVAAQCCMSRTTWIPGENAEGPVAAWLEIPITYMLEADRSVPATGAEPTQACVVVRPR